MSIKIMVVDDSKTTREIFKKILPNVIANDEIEILEAEDGEEGFFVLDNNPDLKIIFLDMNMPSMNGDEFLDILRFKPEYDDDIQVMIVSTETAPETITNLIESGANGFIPKPATISNITNSLRVCGKNLDIELVEPEEINKTTNTEIEKVDNNIFKILVVDDSPLILKMYQFHLPQLFKNHIEIFTAINGKDALEVLSKNSDINLIFLDINMPIMDGYQFLQTFNVMSKFKDISVVMATTEAKKETVSKILKLGAMGYLKKPFSIDNLTHILKSVKNKHSNIELADINITPNQKVDNGKVKIMVVDDSKTIRSIFVGLIPAIIENEVEIIQAENGKEAIKLLKDNKDTRLIFLDINMPVMNGETTLKTIKMHPAFKSIKIAMCSAEDDVEHQQTLRIDGADINIMKPFTPTNLKDVIINLNIANVK